MSNFWLPCELKFTVSAKRFNMKEEVLKQLRKLTGKKYVVLTTRGNTAIKEAMKIAKDKGYVSILVPDQGGWLTYEEYPHELGLREVKLKTNDGIIDLEDLSEYRDCAVILQSYAGYYAKQPMEEIKKICKENNLFLIEDATPALGDKLYGNIILGSFGKWKPVNLGTGGFIAHNYKAEVEETFEGSYDKLLQKLQELPQRVEKLKKICGLVKHDLKDLNVLNKDLDGIVVIVAYDNETQKKLILEYCERMHYETTECPRYIRVNREAISIEIKRIA